MCCCNIEIEDNSEIVILKCIDFIHNLEAKKGLNREQVIDKYTHGLCGFLAQSIKIILDGCGKKGVRREHFNVSASHDMLTMGNGLSGNKTYYDISGKFTESQIHDYLSSMDKNAKYSDIDCHDCSCIDSLLRSVKYDGKPMFDENDLSNDKTEKELTKK